MLSSLGVVAYTSGFFTALWGYRPILSTLFVGVGLTVNLIVLISQYYAALPMMPMYLGIAGVSTVLSIIWLCCYGRVNKEKLIEKRIERRSLLGIILFIVLATFFFPKNFYVPFLRSNIIWSHVFLLSGILAKSFLLQGGVKAIGDLYRDRIQANAPDTHSSMTNWIVYGYGLLTVSLFSGELWSYLGWGTPVVWHDAAVTTVLALWLYWTCFLHLLFISLWRQNQRRRFVIAGAVLVLFFVCHPDMGPFRLPFQGWMR